MSIVDLLVDEISAKMQRVTTTGAPTVVYATWLNAEVANPLLSSVRIDNITYRNVAKGAHVTGLTAGALCICITGGAVPLTILLRIG